MSITTMTIITEDVNSQDNVTMTSLNNNFDGIDIQLRRLSYDDEDDITSDPLISVIPHP